ncbi:hypothetical protein [Amphritea japonica]|nr:hypothetical protein [Amphritea japonica]
MILFASMKALGCSLIPHPVLNNGSPKRPDFLVTTPEGDEFYLEAIVVTEQDLVPGAEANKNAVLDTLDTLESPNFFLAIDADGHPNSRPSSRNLNASVSEWLETLNPDEVSREFELNGVTTLPKLEWQHDGWEVEFLAIPKNEESRGTGDRLIGMNMPEVRPLDTGRQIKKAIKTKGNKYGELSKPLIIAIGVDSKHVDKLTAISALFGDETITIDRNSGDVVGRGRKPNGAWLSFGGPQYTRVSGAWLFKGNSPWCIAKLKQGLFMNPWANYQVPSYLDAFPHCKANSEDELVFEEGFCLGCLLDLPQNWPEN